MQKQYIDGRPGSLAGWLAFLRRPLLSRQGAGAGPSVLGGPPPSSAKDTRESVCPCPVPHGHPWGVCRWVGPACSRLGCQFLSSVRRPVSQSSQSRLAVSRVHSTAVLQLCTATVLRLHCCAAALITLRLPLAFLLLCFRISSSTLPFSTSSAPSAQQPHQHHHHHQFPKSRRPSCRRRRRHRRRRLLGFSSLKPLSTSSSIRLLSVHINPVVETRDGPVTKRTYMHKHTHTPLSLSSSSLGHLQSLS